MDGIVRSGPVSATVNWVPDGPNIKVGDVIKVDFLDGTVYYARVLAVTVMPGAGEPDESGYPTDLVDVRLGAPTKIREEL